MSDRVTVSINPTSFTVTPGGTAQATVTLRNSGQAVDQFTVSVEGLEAGWYSLPVSSVALFPNDQDTLKIVLSPPQGVGKGGSYPVRVKVTSQENPGESSAAELSLRLMAVPEVGIEITPAVTRGRKARYQVVVTNPGSDEAVLDLAAKSVDKRLKLALGSNSIKVPGGGRTEAEVNASLHWLSLFWGKAGEFQIAATAPGLPEARTAAARLTAFRWYNVFSRIRLPWLAKPPTITEFKASTEDKREFRLTWAVKRSAEVKLDDEKVERQGGVSARPIEARVYMLTATNRYGVSTRSVEVRPMTVPQARTSDRIKVSLSQTQAKATAGGAPVPILVQVQNTGQIVDKFLVEVEGIESTWYSRSASSIALMPQASGQAQIMLSPPKQKPVRAGTYPFAVTVRSQTASGEATILLGELEVLPLVEFKAEVRPYRVTSRGKAKFRVRLANEGVSQVGLVLEASDLDEGLSFKFKEDAPSLAAWSSSEIGMIAKAKHARIVGEKKRYDVKVTCRTADGKVQTASCEMYHQPLMASWKPVWRTIRIIIALTILIVAASYVVRLGGGWRALIDSPSTWSAKFGETIEGWLSR